MKKKFVTIVLCACLFSFSACGKGETPPPIWSSPSSSSSSSSSSSKKPVTPIKPGGNFDGGDDYNG